MKSTHGLTAALLFLAFQPASAEERLIERAPTKFVEDGKAISLEVVIFKPTGSGPFPTVMFNHGSTGKGNDPSLFAKTWTSDDISRFLQANSAGQARRALIMCLLSIC